MDHTSFRNVPTEFCGLAVARKLWLIVACLHLKHVSYDDNGQSEAKQYWQTLPMAKSLRVL